MPWRKSHFLVLFLVSPMPRSLPYRHRAPHRFFEQIQIHHPPRTERAPRVQAKKLKLTRKWKVSSFTGFRQSCCMGKHSTVVYCTAAAKGSCRVWCTGKSNIWQHSAVVLYCNRSSTASHYDLEHQTRSFMLSPRNSAANGRWFWFRIFTSPREVGPSRRGSRI